MFLFITARIANNWFCFRRVDCTSWRRSCWPRPSARWWWCTRYRECLRSVRSWTRTRAPLTSARQSVGFTSGWHCSQWSWGEPRAQNTPPLHCTHSIQHINVYITRWTEQRYYWLSSLDLLIRLYFLILFILIFYAMYTDFNIIHGILISFKNDFIYLYYFCPLVLWYFLVY